MDNGVNIKSGENNTPASPISDIIDKVLQNPELLTLVASVLGGSKKNEPESGATPTEAAATAETAAQAVEETESQAVPASSTAPSGGLGDLSSLDLPDIIATLSPLLSGFSKPPAGGHHGGGHLDHHHHHPHDNKTTLLHAIKPFLSHERREAIDYMIKFGKLAEIFKGFS